MTAIGGYVLRVACDQCPNKETFNAHTRAESVRLARLRGWRIRSGEHDKRKGVTGAYRGKATCRDCVRELTTAEEAQ